MAITEWSIAGSGPTPFSLAQTVLISCALECLYQAEMPFRLDLLGCRGNARLGSIASFHAGSGDVCLTPMNRPSRL